VLPKGHVIADHGEGASFAGMISESEREAPWR